MSLSFAIHPVMNKTLTALYWTALRLFQQSNYMANEYERVFNKGAQHFCLFLYTHLFKLKCLNRRERVPGMMSIKYEITCFM